MAVEQTTGEKLRLFIEAYGVGVRAGVLTPNLDDEKAVREMFGLPIPNDSVVASWAKTDGVRSPITVAAAVQEVDNTKPTVRP